MQQIMVTRSYRSRIWVCFQELGLVVAQMFIVAEAGIASPVVIEQVSLV